MEEAGGRAGLRAARRVGPAAEFGGVCGPEDPTCDPPRLYSRLISISLPRKPGFGSPGPAQVC